MLPIHFFTIVLNGMPFIKYHLPMMEKLRIPWRWHVVEGAAKMAHCDIWAIRNGGTLPPDSHDKDFLSIDGTREYLDTIKDHPNVTVYRPQGEPWDGRLGMVKAPEKNYPDDCLLWQVDSDELWESPQIERVAEMFAANPQRTAAIFCCHYFVGDRIMMDHRHPELPWLRVWRYSKSLRWLSHSPPILASVMEDHHAFADMGKMNPFTQRETVTAGAVFQHYGYCTDDNVKFKESNYGYAGLYAGWKRLQGVTNFPVRLKDFLSQSWVHESIMVNRPEKCGVKPLAHIENGEWKMEVL